MESKPKNNILPTIEIILYTLIVIPFMSMLALSTGAFIGSMLDSWLLFVIILFFILITIMPSSIFIYHSLSDIQPPRKRKPHIIFLYIYATVHLFVSMRFLIPTIETAYFDEDVALSIIIIAFPTAIATALSATIAIIAIRIKRGRATATSQSAKSVKIR
ncbi:MAG: hypothetical protein FWG87_05975 [Defluviitaleaceae bacterium]|nr:hypothetical protein [Defluviitaleaceae bacterium]